mmetsp:Transcript_6617/g.27227  ORF Transcript_6617/g.27227 Transcript_6617/m.27227 type:complete len:336 (-) Transcript_6617:1783-2790(-)
MKDTPSPKAGGDVVDTGSGVGRPNEATAASSDRIWSHVPPLEGADPAGHAAAHWSTAWLVMAAPTVAPWAHAPGCTEPPSSSRGEYAMPSSLTACKRVLPPQGMGHGLSHRSSLHMHHPFAACSSALRAAAAWRSLLACEAAARRAPGLSLRERECACAPPRASMAASRPAFPEATADASAALEACSAAAGRSGANRRNRASGSRVDVLLKPCTEMSSGSPAPPAAPAPAPAPAAVAEDAGADTVTKMRAKAPACRTDGCGITRSRTSDAVGEAARWLCSVACAPSRAEGTTHTPRSVGRTTLCVALAAAMPYSTWSSKSTPPVVGPMSRFATDT